MTNMLRTNIYFSLLLLTVLNVQAVLGQSVTVVVPGGPCPNGAEYEFGFDDTGCPDCTVVGWSITGSPTSYNHGSTITARWSAAGTYHVTAKFRTSVNNTVYFSQPFPVTIFPPSTPRLTLTSSPPYLIKTDVTYSTDPSKSDYVWTVVGVLNTDYIKVSGGLSSSRNITIRWLTPGSKTVRVRYTDTGSCATNTSSVTHSFAIRPPEAPRNLVATRTSASQINLTWTDASDDETSFEIERSLTDAEGFTPLATVSAGTATYASTGLTFSTRYFYRVRAVNAGGPSAYCDEANARTYPADGGIRRPLNDLAYEYKYDFRNRMIAKKVPGAGWVYMVYDKRDRLVMTQDGNQRTENKWSFTKYDALNRPVITGIYTHADPVSQAVMSSFISTTQLWETYNGNAATHGYTNDVFPRAGTILTVTYYDTYAFRDNLIGGTDYNYKSDELEGQLPAAYASVIGQVTGTKVNVLNTTNYLWTVNYYDDKYRVVQTTSSNQKSGYDRITTVLDFPGNPLKTRTTHCINGATCTSVIRRFEYDHAMRLTKTWHKADENDEVLLTENEYDELGQLVTKKLHSEDANTFKQHVDYRYNIRGWLTRINNSDLSNNSDSGPRDFFGMNLAYNENIGGIAIPSPQFNGNISATTWSTNLGLGISALSQPTEKAYTFNYDPLNRLTGAVTQEKVTGWNSSNEFHENNLSYDLNGNILKLSRRGSQGVLMDSLMYDYGAGTAKSNKLLKVTDAGDAVKGFIEGTHTGNDYAYDNNGNMTHDLNKQIGSVLADATNRITYNHLNLPEKVQKNNGEKMINVYDAAGRKLRQIGRAHV